MRCGDRHHLQAEFTQKELGDGMRGASRHSGLTLLELMIVVSVISIVLAVGVPSFRSIIASNRLATQSNDFLVALSTARSEAMKRGIYVTVCRSSNGSSCATATGGWNQGWIVFAENAGNLGTVDASAIATGLLSSAPIRRASDGRVFARGMTLAAATTTSADEIILRREAIKANTLTNTTQPDRVTFNDQGMTNSFSTFRLCDAARAQYQRNIVLASTGRTRLDKFDGNGAGC